MSQLNPTLMVLLISFGLLSGARYAAGDEGSCSSSNSPTSVIEDFQKRLPILQLHAASDEDVKRAPCRKNVPSTAEMESWLKRFFVGFVPEKATTVVHGVTLRDQPRALIGLFAQMTTPRDGTRPSFTVPAGCQDFICATQAIFGKESALPLTYLLARYGYNASHVTGAGSSSMVEPVVPFSPKQLNRLIAAAGDLPASMTPLFWDHPMNHASPGAGYRLHGLVTIANARVTIFDPWDHLTASKQEYAVLHEMAHNIGTTLNLDDAQEWYALSGWTIEAGRGWVAKNPGKMVSIYAGVGPWEDFAETVTAYRYRPEHVRKISPEKYRYIKETVFNGVEFTNAAACTNPKLISEMVYQRTEAALREFWQKPLPNQIFQDCREQMLTFYGDADFTKSQLPDDLKDCLVASAIKSIVESNRSGKLTEGIRYPDKFLKESLLRTKKFKLDKVARSAAVKALNQTFREMFRDGFEAFLPELKRGWEKAQKDRASPFQFCFTPEKQNNWYWLSDSAKRAFVWKMNYASLGLGQQSGQIITGWLQKACFAALGPEGAGFTDYRYKAALERMFHMEPPAPSVPVDITEEVFRPQFLIRTK